MWTELQQIASAPECVAVGECGLNYSKDFSEPHVQRAVFKRQVSVVFTNIFDFQGYGHRYSSVSWPGSMSMRIFQY